MPSGGTSDYAPEMIHAAAKGEPYACFVRPDARIPFLAMQLLNGASLDDLLKKKGALTIKQVLKLGAQIGEGLAAAHAVRAA